MYTKRNYGFWMTFNWSKWPFIYGLLYSFAICIFTYFIKVDLSIPWQPIGVIGIAVAFYLGFKNNSSYDRTWEARKIWGGIVNNSRTFGAAVVSFVNGENSKALHQELIRRHIAWMTALRHQLRLSRPWEHIDERVKGLYVPTICEDYKNRLEGELGQYLLREELDALKGKTNIAAQLLKNQAVRLQELRDQNNFEDFRHMELHQLIANLYAEQGKAERIKNFPFPRQYASTALWLTLVFCCFVPFGLLEIFIPKTGFVFWFCPIISALIIWIFFLMEKIGDYSENPFEGTYNDVPITTIARGIEIDLLEMINAETIPKVITEENGFQM